MASRKDKEALGAYIKNLREKKGFSLDQVCEGLCTSQQLSKLEKGEKATSKLLQDALLERLGVGAEDYEQYLSPEDYDRWEMRQRILHRIIWAQTEPARELLKEYYCRYAKDSEGSPWITDRLERQFCLSAWAQIRVLEEAPDKELGAIIDEAVSLTMPGPWEKPLKEQAFSFKELNLLLEAERYRRGGPLAKHYKEILSYMEASGADYLGMAKIYPKAAYLLCSSGPETTGETEEGLLRYCGHAIEILRNSMRLYYLWELLDLREQYLGRQPGSSAQIGGGKGTQEIFKEKEGRETSLKFSNTPEGIPEEESDDSAYVYRITRAWKRVLETIYAEFQMPKATVSYCYLYTEKGVSCINDVVRIRRRMLGMSRKALCDGICDEKTLRRLERKETSPQRAVTLALFERLGLPDTLIHTELVTASPQARRLMAKLRWYDNNLETQKAEALLSQIRSLISADIRCNQQMLVQQEANLQKLQKKTDNETYRRRLQEALELTLPLEVFLQKGEKYLTYQEQTCIQNMMQGMDKESEEFWICMERFQEMYRPVAEGELLETVNGIYGFIMRYVQSELGNHGEYDLSDQYLQLLLEEDLRTYRMPSIADCLYARWWNYTQRKQRGIPTCRDLDTETELSNCIQLSRLSKLTSDESFFKGKLQYEKEK